MAVRVTQAPLEVVRDTDAQVRITHAYIEIIGPCDLTVVDRSISSVAAVPLGGGIVLALSKKLSEAWIRTSIRFSQGFFTNDHPGRFNLMSLTGAVLFVTQGGVFLQTDTQHYLGPSSLVINGEPVDVILRTRYVQGGQQRVEVWIGLTCADKLKYIDTTFVGEPLGWYQGPEKGPDPIVAAPYEREVEVYELELSQQPISLNPPPAIC